VFAPGPKQLLLYYRIIPAPG